ncbi:MAG: ATP-dependent DNA ligase [Methanosarcinales archaeon]|nr:ATP-dependent DNA ligase [Methanosarcinales archaeon]
MTSFKDFSNVCEIVDTLTSSLEITDVVACFLKSIESQEEISIAVYFMLGKVFPEWSDKEIGIGVGILYSALSKASNTTVEEIEEIVRTTGDIGKAASIVLDNNQKKQVTFASFSEDKVDLSLKNVYERFDMIAKASGTRSQSEKIKHLRYLFNSVSKKEARYLSYIAIEEFKIGVGEGIIRNAIAKAFDTPSHVIERGFMLTNDFGIVAIAAKKGGENEVSKLEIKLHHPIKVMFSGVVENIESVINELDHVAIEWKFDGARVQIHKEGDKVTIFSRRLENITKSLPDVVEEVKASVLEHSIILDGEVIAIDESNNLLSFQDLLKRFRRKHNVETIAKKIPLILNVFDIIYLNGKTLIDLSLINRRKLLKKSIKDTEKVKLCNQMLTNDLHIINVIYDQALKAGHEGIMIKDPNSIYTLGKRSKNWMKKKPIMDTLDLVVIGAEWGYGRRTNMIGSYTIACKNDNEFLSLGKVGTGIADEVLSVLTKRFSDFILFESGSEIEIKPEIVFEIAFEEIQRSKNYNSGYALRFPRFVRVRDDKSKDEINTIESIKEQYDAQHKGV